MRREVFYEQRFNEANLLFNKEFYVGQQVLFSPFMTVWHTWNEFCKKFRKRRGPKVALWGMPQFLMLFR